MAIIVTDCEKCGRVRPCDPHHIYKRGNHDDIIRLCRECHNWVEAHPKLSKIHGWSKDGGCRCSKTIMKAGEWRCCNCDRLIGEFR